MDSIRQKLATGKLPQKWDRTRTALGGIIGPCAGCDAPTSSDNLAVWCERAGLAFVLHPDCYVIWEQLREEALDRR